MKETPQKILPIEEREDDLSCDICDFPAVEIHCKVICTNCGYTRDCSDP